jgi:hypothetical protein
MRPSRASSRTFVVAVVCWQVVASAPVLARGSVDHEAARAERTHGTVALNLGRYDAAVEHFARAYSLSQDPEILFHLAQAYRLGDKPDKALATYSAFLRAAGARAKYRSQIERAAVEIELITSFMLSRGPEGRVSDQTKPPASEPGPVAESVATAAVEPAPTVAPNAEPVKPEPPPPPVPALVPKLAPTPTPALTFASEAQPPLARPIHKRWWFWTSLTVAVAAGGVAAWWYSQPHPQAPASTYGAVRVLP